MSEKYRVVVPSHIPLSEHASYAANAIAQTEAREQARAAAEQERREKARAIKEALEEVDRQNAERDKRKLEAQRKRDEASFEDSLRAAFFEANPQASESDFQRNRQTLRDEALKARTLDLFAGRENLVAINKAILKKRGSYSAL